MNIKYLLRRIGQLIPVLLLVSMFSFFLVNIAPGDPATSYRTPDMTEEQYQKIRDSFGLNDPIPVQYVRWLERILQGNWGSSITNRQSVTSLILSRLPATIGLMLSAMVFSVLISILLGALAGLNKGKWIDKLINGFTYIGISIPSFWFGILLMLLFSLRLKLLPSSGMTTTGDGSFLDIVRHGILPVLAISVSKIATYTRYVRANVISQMSEEYVVTAIAKGVPGWGVMAKHVLKNCILPIITLVGMGMGDIVTGSFVIESIFGWPGLGTMSLNSILARDFPLMMGSTMLSCIVLITGNLIADLVCAVADPRIRLEGRTANE